MEQYLSIYDYNKMDMEQRGIVQNYEILTISAVVSSSRKLARSYPRSASSKKSVSSASFFSELRKRCKFAAVQIQPPFPLTHPGRRRN